MQTTSETPERGEQDSTSDTSPYAGCLAQWEVGPLEPPRYEAKRLASIVGPGVLLAGSAIGAGEWLFGPAVTALYGGTFLWLATISIVLQVFYNLEVVRYTLYCGEPIFVGFFRTRPGPRLWTTCYLTLFLAHIWPFMAANAAVPLAAAFLGHLPGDGTMTLAGVTVSEPQFVKLLGFAIFGCSLLVLIFGGTVYRMLEAIMTFKLVVVLLFMLIVNIAFVSPSNMWEVITGFFRFGSVPIRADTVIAGNHFSISERDGDATYRIQGSVSQGKALVTGFAIKRDDRWQAIEPGAETAEETVEWKSRLSQRAEQLCRSDRFYIDKELDGQTVRITGRAEPSGWQPDMVTITGRNGTRQFESIDAVPEPIRHVAAELIANQGFQRVGLWSYWLENRRLPDVNWSLVAAFTAIAGAGGLTNCLFSNYARDKGWGMGAATGAIPSAIGGRQIALSHVGRVFETTEQNLASWRAWRRHVFRDQVGIWMVCCFVGLALPCMMSLEFIRNAPVSGIQVAAMTADGIAGHFSEWKSFWWASALFVSFLALAPNSVMAGDLIARMWTDLLWIGSARLRQLGEHKVSRVYYSLLGVYAVWGTIALAFLNPLQIATLGAVLGNVALGASAFHTLYVNRTLLPRALQPSLFMQAGLIACGVFFLSITAVVVWTL